MSNVDFTVRFFSMIHIYFKRDTFSKIRLLVELHNLNDINTKARYLTQCLTSSIHVPHSSLISSVYILLLSYRSPSAHWVIPSSLPSQIHRIPHVFSVFPDNSVHWYNWEHSNDMLETQSQLPNSEKKKGKLKIQ